MSPDVVIQPHKKPEFISKTNLDVHILMMKKNPSVVQNGQALDKLIMSYFFRMFGFLFCFEQISF